MRSEFRRASFLTGAAATVVGSLLTWGVAFVIFRVQRNRVTNGEPLVPPWVLVLVIVATLTLAVTLTWYLAGRISQPRATRVTQSVRQVTQRADDYGSGTFEIDPTRTDELIPLTSGLDEIDSLSRILDRNHRLLMRALMSERTFAVDASHQLKTPLSGLRLQLEEIEDAKELDTAHEGAQVAIGQTDRLSEVVTELLHRTRAGHADGGQSVSLDTILGHLDKEWAAAFHEKDRTIRCTVPRGLVVRASSSTISQVTNTLIENALVHGAGAVTVRAFRSGPSAVIEVADEGEGLDPVTARRIFARGSTTSGDGTGIGLAVARETAEACGGRLELTRSKPTVFAFYVSQATTPAPID